MKLLTLNFLTCAIKTCKTQASSFPLHPKDAELEIQEADVNLPFLKNILPRLMWEELRTICKEVSNHAQLGLPDLPPTPPSPADLVEGPSEDTTEGTVQAQVDEQPSQTAKDLHRVLLETCIQEGKLVCGCCGHEYAVKEGVANFLLPGHLV
ncbi:adomet-dependent trna methyltransferase complex subunit [Stagonosporopsis vannaccii]|nr:adomet-dependent trna methyltransferase complex subunit [Stagonosporopsis vannaccii]